MMTATRWLAGCLAVALILPVAARADGAIAHGEDGSNGISYNYRGPRSADDAALNNCGSDCRVVQRFRNACGAVARSRSGGFGYAVRDRRGEAERAAMGNCEQYNNSCRIFLSGCDG